MQMLYVADNHQHWDMGVTSTKHQGTEKVNEAEEGAKPTCT